MTRLPTHQFIYPLNMRVKLPDDVYLPQSLYSPSCLEGGLGHLFLAFAIWTETLALCRLGYVKRMLVETTFDGLERRTVSRWGIQSDT